MNIIIWLVLGGLLGWVSGLVTRTGTPNAAPMNVLMGITGALLGGWLLSPLLGVATPLENELGLASIGASLVGAMGSLASFELARRLRRRRSR